MTDINTQTIRSSRTYFFEVLFVRNAAGDGLYYNPVNVNLSNINSDTKSSTNRPVLYTISLSDFVIEHEDDWTKNHEEDRCLVVLASEQLTQGKTRYMTLLGSDSGIGLFGSNSIVLQNLPDYAMIQIGFVNVLDATDKNIYDPNKDFTTTDSTGTITITQKSQAIKYALFRFAITIQYL